jgi:hypothetical protein
MELPYGGRPLSCEGTDVMVIYLAIYAGKISWLRFSEKYDIILWVESGGDMSSPEM